MKQLSTLIGICLLSLSLNAHAKDKYPERIQTQYGIGIEHGGFTSQVKSISLSTYNPLFAGLSYGSQVGFLSDARDDLSSVYLFALVGTTLYPTQSFYVENYFGPGVITSTGKKLSGAIQFSTHLGLGFRDKRTGNEIGVLWKHISNAGMNKPNLGRDLLMLSVGISLGGAE